MKDTKKVLVDYLGITAKGTTTGTPRITTMFSKEHIKRDHPEGKHESMQDSINNASG
jgi:hypothetical protein